jgi:hypothetical protein
LMFFTTSGNKNRVFGQNNEGFIGTYGQDLLDSTFCS